MALSFYLNEINNNNKINVQTNASFTSKVGDFDVGTLAIEWKRTKNKIVPFTKLFIVDDTNNDIWCFVVLSDDVEVVKKTPDVLYVHNLTVIQNTYELTTHLVRNSVFTQPFSSKKAKLKAVGSSIVDCTGLPNSYYSYSHEQDIYIAYDLSNSKYAYYHEKTLIDQREKVKRIYIDIKTLTSAFMNCSITADRFLLGDNRAYEENFYEILNFTINKYSEDDTLINSINVTANNGQKIVEISNTNNFFEKGYKYELVFNSNQILKINQYSSSTQFFVGVYPDEGETWKVPSIQTIFDCTLVIETYYYSLQDVLHILNIQCKKIYNGQASHDSFYLIDDDSVLKTTIAPDLSFSSEDLWSCVADTLKYIDAIPLLDENNNLTYEYLNDYSRDNIEFDKTDEKSSLNNQYYTNSLVANYQNAKQENAIVYPGENVFKRVSSKSYGVPGNNDYEMRVDKPIDYIDRVYLLLENNETWDCEAEFWTLATLYNNLTKIDFKTKLPNNILDLSDAIYEQSIYSLLDYGDENAATPNQLNTLYYVRNSNSIYLGGIRENGTNFKYEVYKKACVLVMRYIFGIPEAGIGLQTYINGNILPYIYNLQYCIKYHAVFNGRASQESTINKHYGETYTTQEQGGVNLNRMGNNMQGLIARLGNETESITIPVTDYGSRIKKGSLWVDDDGKKYIANSVKTTFSTSSQKVIVEAQFSRNFNLISQFTKVDQEKRFYDINNNLISKGYENIVEYLYFSTKGDVTSETTAFSEIGIDYVLANNFRDSPSRKADIAAIDTFEFETDITPVIRDTYIPFHVYGLGNSICFEMGYESAINAGDRLVDKDGKLLNETNLYTVQNGFADKVNLKIYARSDNSSIYATEDFPNMATLLSNISKTAIVDIRSYLYFKKPNEILHVNYSLAFMPKPDEEIFFGDTLINRNQIIREISDNNPTKTFYLYAGNEQYSIIDNKVLNTHTNYGTVTFSYTRSGSYGNMTFTLDSGEVENAKAWAISDENGNIYFAANEKLKNRTSVTLYFALRRNRL